MTKIELTQEQKDYLKLLIKNHNKRLCKNFRVENAECKECNRFPICIENENIKNKNKQS